MVDTSHNTATDKAENAAFDRAKFVRHLASVLAALILIGVLVGLVAGVHPLESRAAVLTNGRPIEVRFDWPRAHDPNAPNTTQGTWMPRQFQDELTSLARSSLSGSLDPFSRNPLRNLGRNLAVSGWFDGEPTVKRAGDSTLLVSGAWRIPAAVIRFQEREYLVSWAGKLMPPVYSDGAAGLRRIIGVQEGPPVDATGARDYLAVWPGEDAAAAIELLALLTRQKWATQVLGIDAGEYREKSSLSILTTDGTTIVWGGRPSKPRWGEPSSADKLRNISTLWMNTRRIDGGYPLIEVTSPYLIFDKTAASEAAKARAAAPPRTPAAKPR